MELTPREKDKLLLFTAALLAERRPIPVPPARLGDFRLLKEIGRGSMAVVYEALQLSLDRRVALKILGHSFD